MANIMVHVPFTTLLEPRGAVCVTSHTGFVRSRRCVISGVHVRLLCPVLCCVCSVYAHHWTKLRRDPAPWVGMNFEELSNQARTPSKACLFALSFRVLKQPTCAAGEFYARCTSAARTTSVESCFWNGLWRLLHNIRKLCAEGTVAVIAAALTWGLVVQY